MQAFVFKHVDVGYWGLSVDCGTRGVVSTIPFPIRSLMKRTEKKKPTITYLGMIPGVRGAAV